MPGKFLFDTNIVIGIFAKEAEILNRLAAAENVFVPSIVLGELYYGARQSARPAANVARVDDFAHASTVIFCDRTTAQQYGVVKNNLRTKGHPIPENDIWIGSMAIQHGMILVTRDAHFREIDTLQIECW